MKLSARAYDLFQAFEEPGCPVCRLTADSVHAYLESLVYEYVSDPPTHMAVRAARGFCPAHAWHMLERVNASGLGIAVFYEGLVRNLLKDMGEVGPHSGRRQVAQAAAALEPTAACPACTHRATVEDHLLRNLLDHLDEGEFAAAFARSAGLCLPHLRQALRGSGRTPARARLLAIQQDIWARLQRDLAEYIRKNDYRYVGEPMGDEGTSPRRAIEGMAGLRDV